MAILQSVQTALRVLETVATHQPIGVSDVGRHLKINKMTAQRCLQTLCACGWIKREGDAPQTRWQITSKAFSIGRHVAENGNLRETALPVMKKLWEKIGESIHLVIAEGERAVLLERLETPQPVRLFLPMGGSAPLHAVASGKALALQVHDAVQVGCSGFSQAHDKCDCGPFSWPRTTLYRRVAARCECRRRRCWLMPVRRMW